MANDIFKKYYSRLRGEGLLKSFLCGLVVSFSVLLITAAICWFVGFKGLWVSAVIFGVSLVASVPLFYYFLFRPTTKKMASRIDALGLEERILTMTELEGDTSFIAMKQREDAVAALGGVNAGLIKLAVAVPLVIACVAVGICGAGMTTVHALNVAGEIPSGLELVQGTAVEAEAKSYTITYKLEDWAQGTLYVGGTIKYEYTVTITEGEVTEPVYVLPASGWVFCGWSDGNRSDVRVDGDVKSDAEYIARFAPIDDIKDEDVGDAANDAPNQQNNSDDNKNGDDTPSLDDPSDPNENQDSDKDGSGGGAGGSFDPNNQVIDGKTYYGNETFDDAYGDAVSDASSNDGIPEDGKGVIGNYFDTIAK